LEQRAFIVFTDGACQGNPGPGGWAAIVASPEGEVWELGGGTQNTTNNRMELQATLEALLSIPEASAATKVLLYTDSKYVIQGITEWIHGWEARGWLTKDGKDVSHKDLWLNLKSAVNKLTIPVEWKHIAGHSAFPGNERCDRIAVAYTRGGDAGLYRGPRQKYLVDLTSLPVDLPPGHRVPPKDPFYLSVIDGQIFRDRDWPTCEARVKGRQGVKFKKVRDTDEESRVLTQWGIKK